MKRKFTEARKANRTYPKIAAGGIYCMSVAERRKNHIVASDSAEYDIKHGIVTNVAKKNRGIFRLFGRKREPKAKEA